MTERSPVVSVELTLDAEGDAAVRADWDALAEAGLSSAGAHPGSSNRPHLSVAVRDAAGEPAALRPLVSELPLELRMAGLVVFPHTDRVVLARAIVPAAGLLAFHAAVAEAVAGWGAALPATTPGAWMPHLTLARRLRRADLPRALALLAADPAPLRATGLRVWDGGRRQVTTVR